MPNSDTETVTPSVQVVVTMIAPTHEEKKIFLSQDVYQQACLGLLRWASERGHVMRVHLEEE